MGHANESHPSHRARGEAVKTAEEWMVWWADQWVGGKTDVGPADILRLAQCDALEAAAELMGRATGDYPVHPNTNAASIRALKPKETP